MPHSVRRSCSVLCVALMLTNTGCAGSASRRFDFSTDETRDAALSGLREGMEAEAVMADSTIVQGIVTDVSETSIRLDDKVVSISEILALSYRNGKWSGGDKAVAILFFGIVIPALAAMIIVANSLPATP